MDARDPHDDSPREPRPGDRVGLGRVIEDHAAGAVGRRTPDPVDEASDESFPASDPTAFAPDRPGPRTEAPETPREDGTDSGDVA